MTHTEAAYLQNSRDERRHIAGVAALGRTHGKRPCALHRFSALYIIETSDVIGTSGLVGQDKTPVGGGGVESREEGIAGSLLSKKKKGMVKGKLSPAAFTVRHRHGESYAQGQVCSCATKSQVILDLAAGVIKDAISRDFLRRPHVCIGFPPFRCNSEFSWTPEWLTECYSHFNHSWNVLSGLKFLPGKKPCIANRCA
jgi:hypothetical protein